MQNAQSFVQYRKIGVPRIIRRFLCSWTAAIENDDFTVCSEPLKEKEKGPALGIVATTSLTSPE